MSSIASKFRRKFFSNKKRKLIPLTDLQEAEAVSAEVMEKIAPPERLKDYDPLQASHILIQNGVSAASEGLAGEPELRKFVAKYNAYVNKYISEYSPISLVSKSLFNFWMMYDFTFRHEKETIGELMKALADT